MRLIGVLDLLGGRAVHARAGRREAYEPVARCAGAGVVDGDAHALVRAYVEALGVGELYAADLDAITTSAPQTMLVASLGDLASALGAPLWLDAGVTTEGAAREALALGAARVVVGLETLAGWPALAAICAAAGGGRVAFSLDLRGGMPIAHHMPANDEPPDALAARAADAGAGAVIVLDLARVGTGQGVDLALMERVRRAAPDVALLAGGGVRAAADLARLADAGCDGALVASALLDGRIGAADVAAARALVGRDAHPR